MVEEIKKFLVKWDYPTTLIKLADNLNEEDARNLFNLITEYTFGDYEIEWMIYHPESINEVRRQCINGGICRSLNEIMVNEITKIRKERRN